MPEKSLLSKVKYQLTTHSLTIATFAVIFLVWEVVVQIFNINRVVLPAPSEIATVMLNLQKGYYVPWDKHISVTLFEILAGFSLAAVVGILLAMVNCVLFSS
jgi:ABC-type nitrate/sulfonate/bicarbonate transport system permease component